MFDLTKFSDIVIYVGGNDYSNSSDNEYFKEKYEQLLQYIKSITPSSKIHLCTSCPRGDIDVEETNDVIKSICEEHEVKCIEVRVQRSRIDTKSTTPDLGYQLESDKLTVRHHK